MGSFNTKSFTGINQYNQEFILFFVVKNDSRVGQAYKFISMPINVKYDDYGRYELIDKDSLAHKSFLDFMNEKAVELNINRSNDSVRHGEITWDILFNAMQENQLMIHSPQFLGENAPNLMVEVVTFHKHYWDEVMKISIENWFGDQLSLDYFNNMMNNLFNGFLDKNTDIALFRELKSRMSSIINELEGSESYNGNFFGKLLNNLDYDDSDNLNYSILTAQTMQMINYLNAANLVLFPNRSAGQGKENNFTSLHYQLIVDRIKTESETED
jgi:hypothetical protein